MSYIHYPNLVERFEGVVYLDINTQDLLTQTTTVKLQGSNVLNPPVAVDMFTVLKGQDYMSRTIRKSRRNMVEQTRKGKMKLFFDFDDFSGTGIHGDGPINFVRVQELDGSGVVVRTGGWLVVPPSIILTGGRKLLNFTITAPSVSTPGVYTGLPPKDSLVVLTPKRVGGLSVTNTGTNPLFVSLSPNTAEIEVSAGNTVSLPDAGTSLLTLRATGGITTCVFKGILVNGLDL